MKQVEAGLDELRLCVLGAEAYRTVCGLVQSEELVDPAEVTAGEEAWAEIRAIFPAADATPVPGPVAVGRGKGVAIAVLEDGETFSTLAGCRAFLVPGDWDTARIEEALADAPAAPPARVQMTRRKESDVDRT